VSLLRDRPAQPGASSDGPSSWSLSRGLMQESVNTSHRTIDQIAQALVKLARERPLLILLDDLQWADAASLRLLAYVSGDIARWPMLIVTTQRSTETYSGEDRRSAELLRLLTHRNCERIELQRLGEEDVAEYVSAQFGPNVGGEALCRTVYKRSEGNPFFMVELLRPWLGGSEPEPEQLALSDFALDPVRQRRLQETARSVLAGAAVIGHDFDLGLLGYVTQRGADELLEALDGSLANDTIVPSSEVVGGYAFDHELIREVLYADLPASERCRLHLRAGEALLRRRTAGNQVASGELAHHFLAALPQGDVNVAIEHAREAAMASNRLAARSDARKLLERALEALKFGVAPPVETRTVLLLELAMVERALGEPKYRAHLEQAVQLAREHKLGSLLTAAGRMLSLAPGLLVQGDALSVLEAARDVLPASDTKRRAIVLAHLAWTPPNCRSARAVEALLREAESLAEASNDLTARAAVRDAKLFFSGGPATQAAADALVGEIEREIQSHPELFSGRKLTVLTHRYITAMQRGNLAAMERASAARAAELAKLNNLELNWHQERMLFVHSLNRGEFAGAAERLMELRARAKQLNLQAWPTLWAVDYGSLLLWTTGMGEFAERLRPTFAWQSSDSPQARAHKLRGMVDCGFLDDARAALAQISVESLHDFPTDRDYLAFLAHYAVASMATGSLAHCSALYEELSPFPQYFAVGISYHCYSSISHLLGGLALALGREAKALEHFEEAVRRNGEMGWKPWLVRSQLDLARLLLTSSKLRDTARATQLLEEALQVAAECGMKPVLEEIQRERQVLAGGVVAG
jgi:tetratricopeptide (TPR) repeat protein